MKKCTEDWMTCHYASDHTLACGWHPDNVEITKVSDETWRQIAEAEGLD